MGKKFFLNLSIISFIVSLGFGVVLQEKYGYKAAEGKYTVLVDSLKAIAAATPDTVWQYDTIRPNPEVKWYERKILIPSLVHGDSAAHLYSDSLVNEEIGIYVQDSV